MDKQQLQKLYARGICECKATMRGRWIGGVYMCTRCQRPVYWTPAPPPETKKARG